MPPEAHACVLAPPIAANGGTLSDDTGDHPPDPSSSAAVEPRDWQNALRADQPRPTRFSRLAAQLCIAALLAGCAASRRPAPPLPMELADAPRWPTQPLTERDIELGHARWGEFWDAWLAPAAGPDRKLSRPWLPSYHGLGAAFEPIGALGALSSITWAPPSSGAALVRALDGFEKGLAPLASLEKLTDGLSALRTPAGAK